MTDITALSGRSEANRRRVAVVLFNLGGPDSLEAVEPFLFNLFNDPAIIGLPFPARPLLAKLISSRRRAEASGNYAHMGGSSPLVAETEAQARALEGALSERRPDLDVRAFLSMRYWRPMTSDAAEAVAAFAPDDIVLLPLYPQLSTTTTGSSLKAWRTAYKGAGVAREVCCFFDSPGWIKANADLITAIFEAGGSPKRTKLLFSAHGLPERVIARGDPYQWQVEKTCEAIVQRLAGEWDWQVCYQSRVGPLKWIGPSTPEAVKAAARDGKGVLLAPIAFVSEHVETLVELDRDYAELAAAEGCPFYLRAPTVSVADDFIADLARLVEQALGRAAGRCAPGASACPPGFSRCPYRSEVSRR